jgi:ferric-dicitrate binding protein FerR (iron transport regulator)
MKDLKDILEAVANGRATTQDEQDLDKAVHDFWNDPTPYRLTSQEVDLMQTEVNRHVSKRRFMWPALMIAASITLAIAASVWMYVIAPQQQVIVDNAENIFYGKNFVHLPDGSTVMLNEGAKLQIDFNNKERVVTLNGEAFFEVYHDARKPFYVKSFTSSMRTKVLGTSFSVSMLPLVNIVSVKTGKVQVTDKDDDYGVVLANEALEVNIETKEVKRSRSDENTKATKWTEQFFILDNTPMEKVASLVEKRFKTKMEFANPEVSKCPINAKFYNGEELSDIMDFISSTTGFTWAFDADKNLITIDGQGCD